MALRQKSSNANLCKNKRPAIAERLPAGIACKVETVET
jgi:hypothetical protein